MELVRLQTENSSLVKEKEESKSSLNSLAQKAGHLVSVYSHVCVCVCDECVM